MVVQGHRCPSARSVFYNYLSSFSFDASTVLLSFSHIPVVFLFLYDFIFLFYLELLCLSVLYLPHRSVFCPFASILDRGFQCLFPRFTVLRPFVSTLSPISIPSTVYVLFSVYLSVFLCSFLLLRLSFCPEPSFFVCLAPLPVKWMGLNLRVNRMSL